MKLSCGVIIINEYNEILLGHSTGNKFFDIFKGMLEANEDPIECAVRECEEETSLILNKDNLIDLGDYKYNKEKRLHLFLYPIKKDLIDIKGLKCESFFINYYTKKQQPEIDYFEWVKIDDVTQKCAKSLGILLSSLKENNSLDYTKNTKRLKMI